MPTEIRETYQGVIDGRTVVSAYRAFAEPDQPYVLTLDLGEDRLAYGTLRPVEADEDFSQEEADAYNRGQIARWVDVLTGLAESALAWEDFVSEIEGIDLDDTVDLDVQYTVNALTSSETDREWTDRDNDRYLFNDGSWHIMTPDDDGTWRRIIDQSVLTKYAPYTPVQ